MVQYPDEPVYSEKYADDYYEYRHVILTKAMAAEARALLASRPLLREEEWRNLGVQQSRGWVHFLNHKPEPHVLLFRRAVGTDPITGHAPPGWKPPPYEKRG